MALDQFMSSTEYRGLAVDGTDFNDSPVIGDISGVVLTRIVVYYSSFINSLTVSVTLILVTGIGLTIHFQPDAL